MRPDQRVIIRGPLTELWNAEGPLPLRRVRDLDRATIAHLLRVGTPTFVLGHGGEAPRWIPASETFTVWQRVRDLVVAPEATYENDGELRYRASEWEGLASGPVVLFEAHH